MMVVPVRGRELAEALSPLVGTIIEIYPRACLLFANPENEVAVRDYKKPNGKESGYLLWDWWTRHFSIEGELLEISDGALDSLVCAIYYVVSPATTETVKFVYDDGVEVPVLLLGYGYHFLKGWPVGCFS